MEKIITYENIRRFAYVNDAVCRMPVKGIVLYFLGANNISMFDADTVEGEFYGEKNLLYVVPYNNPWAWMNRQAVAYTDEILEVLFEKYLLDERIPIASTGNSMGGLSALIYPVFAKRTPVVCVANCPVCDAVFHFSSRQDIPRLFYSALWHEEGDLETALKTVSPLHLLKEMPRIPYHIFHCDNDQAVNIAHNSDVLVSEMRKQGFDVTYDVVHGRGHCKLTYEAKMKYVNYILSAVFK